MVKPKKRWEKKRKYKRDWKEYNEELVRRGTFYLDFVWVRSWKRELAEMNKNKIGAPYQFPESLIQLQAVWLQFTDLRGVEGINRKVVEIGKILDYNDFSTISRRVNATSTKIELPEGQEVYVATKNEYERGILPREVWRRKKKFIKVK